MTDPDVMLTAAGPPFLPPTVRLEVEWGDRRAAADLPLDAPAGLLDAACSWLLDVTRAWDVR